ncbi:MAG: sulfotransferase [Nitratireductor sp.]|nr:sulfotransferase [Nitratireductor sp.]
MITIKQALDMPPEKRQQLLSQVDTALRANKRNVDALLSGASLHHVERRQAKTVELLKQAAALRPKDTMILQWMSVAAGEIRDFASAKWSSKKLVETDPGNPENWQIRGRILESSGDSAGALKAFSRQLEMAGEHAELVFQIANCNFYLSNLEAALKGYRRAVELDPTHALALYAISTIHTFSEDEVPPYLERVEAAVPANKDNPIYNISALYYGAGKALDDIRAFDRAFDYYRKANDVRRPPDVSRLTVPFENYQAAFDVDFAEKSKDWGDQSRRPIFILGMPRSGTTLVESILAAHPKVTAGGEMPVLEDLAEHIGLFRDSPEAFSAKIRGLTRKDVADMARAYLNGVRTLCGKDNLFTDKLPHNFMHVGLILTLFPKARIFHCRRHPLDVCSSIYTNGMTPAHNYYKSDLETLGRYFSAYDDHMAFWNHLFPGRIREVFYEDLIANQELNSRAMIDHVGLPWDDRVMTRDNPDGVVKTLSAWQVRQPVYASAMGKWKRYENHLGPLIEALGDKVATYETALEAIGKDAPTMEAG